MMKVRKIGVGAFSGCSNITSFTFPYGIETIEKSTFEGCSKLVSISEGLRIKIIDERAFKDCTQLETFTIHTSTQGIKKWAFAGCSKLTSIYFDGQQLTAATIDENAFDWNTLQNIYVYSGDLHKFINSSVYRKYKEKFKKRS